MAWFLKSLACLMLSVVAVPVSSSVFMRMLTSRGSERPGSPTNSHSCWSVRSVPNDLRSAAIMGPSGLSTYYQKYTEAYGIPILGSVHVPEDAVKRACYVVRFLFADRQDVRRSYYKHFGRFAVYGQNEVTRSIPEHAYLDPFWDTRARGLGATLTAPVATCAEENALCYASDTYDPNEDIALHEYSHALQGLGAYFAVPGFEARLKSAYSSAMSRGLWANTYAATDEVEYWAEAVQSYFNANTHRDSVNGIHGPVSTRDKLRTYDPAIYALIQEIFPCNNNYITRCGNNQTLRSQEHAQQLRMNCAGSGGTGTGTGTGTNTGTGTGTGTGTWGSCVDKSANCQSWSQTGECSKNQAYMSQNCKKSCNLCSSGGQGTQSGSCSDQSQHCKYWAETGQCTQNAAYMLQNCKKSCNQCSGTGSVGHTGSCADQSTNCQYWSDTGECTKNYAYMSQNCKKSCSLC